MATLIRLLSPNHRRLPSLNPEDKEDAITIANLKHAGWTEYVGPARVDKSGWIIPGSDVNLKILPPGKVGS